MTEMYAHCFNAPLKAKTVKLVKLMAKSTALSQISRIHYVSI